MPAFLHVIPFHEKPDTDVNPESFAASNFFNCELRIANCYNIPIQKKLIKKMNNIYKLCHNLVVESPVIIDTAMLVALEQALILAQERLQAFADDPEFAQKMAVAFGEGIEVGSLQTAWLAGDFSIFPKLAIRNAADINGANGAFAAASNRIYISSKFLENNQEDVRVITSVLLEEVGHWIDSQINQLDTPGDEGYLFSVLVQKQPIGFAELASLHSEDDTTVATINGQSITLEQSTAYTGSNLNEVATGLDQLLLKLQEGINNQVFGAYLPLVDVKPRYV